MKVRSVIRPRTDVDGLQKHELIGEGPTFDAAVASITRQTPDGWIRLYVMTVAD